jgi:hypothetical protein
MILYHAVLNIPRHQEQLQELFQRRKTYDPITFENKLLAILINQPEVSTFIPFPYKQTAG